MITGEILKNAFISGANNIKKYRQQVDELNVFPVPDGDTGTNMYMTTNIASKELKIADDNLSVGDASRIFADALLRGARGNSGVILSLIFRGFSKALAGKDIATSSDFAYALESGMKSAYDVVMKPTEGTILTVIKEASKFALEVADETQDVGEFWAKVCKCAKETLDLTPEMLPVLKKAGVVDAGGKGLLIIFEGMCSVFKDRVIVEFNGDTENVSNLNIGNIDILKESEIAFTYCTEYIICKAIKDIDVIGLRAYLESIGDCVVVVEDDVIIKVHVHTNEPGEAITKSLGFGQLTNIKIENMKEQFENKKLSTIDKNNKSLVYKPVDNSKEYGFVAVAAGDGIHNLFKDLGVDNIVSGGQTMNPSTDDILNAIHATSSKIVFVLPNNKNIIMTAEQAVHMADRKVCVLQSRTIPQGLSAMISFDSEKSLKENQLLMTNAIDNVSTGHITFAARNSNFDGQKIKCGDILALANGKLSFIEKDLSKACLKLIKNLLKKDSMFVTILYGVDVDEEQANEMHEMLKSKINKDIEINLIYGGQPVYYYIISVE